MNSHALRFSVALCALTGLTRPAPCRADLFALVGSERQILRLDSTTGAVLDAYGFDPAMQQVSSTAGLAFDGRILSVVDPEGIFPNFLYRYDVNYNFWYPPAPIFLDPGMGSMQPLTGLGFLRNDNGEWLFGVTRNTQDLPPSTSTRYSLFRGDFLILSSPAHHTCCRRASRLKGSTRTRPPASWGS